MNQEKMAFLQNDFIPLIKKLDKTQQPKWGKMNAQQMVEHVGDFFKVSVNKIHFPLTTPVEHLPKYKEFLLSDKEFRENTKTPVLPEEPLPIRNASMEEAFEELKNDVGEFFKYYQDHPSGKSLHPAFGELDYAEWIQLHHKHVIHHLKQFGLIERN